MRPGTAGRIGGIGAAVILAAVLVAASAPAQEKQAPPGEPVEFTRSELRWAAGWINREVALFMARDIVTKIIARDAVFEMYVGSPWYELGFGRQGQFLQHMSRAREITGHEPFFVARDHESNDIVARVSAGGIEVLLPGEGMFSYLPSRDASFSTLY